MLKEMKYVSHKHNVACDFKYGVNADGFFFLSTFAYSLTPKGREPKHKKQIKDKYIVESIINDANMRTFAIMNGRDANGVPKNIFSHGMHSLGYNSDGTKNDRLEFDPFQFFWLFRKESQYINELYRKMHHATPQERIGLMNSVIDDCKPQWKEYANLVKTCYSI